MPCACCQEGNGRLEMDEFIGGLLNLAARLPKKDMGNPGSVRCLMGFQTVLVRLLHM